MTRLRTYSPVVVWLLIVASCWAFGADGLHHHSLRVIQSPELGVALENGSGCPIDHFLQTLQGGDHPPNLSLDALIPVLELAPLAIVSFTTAEHYSANSPRAPPFSS